MLSAGRRPPNSALDCIWTQTPPRNLPETAQKSPLAFQKGGKMTRAWLRAHKRLTGAAEAGMP